MSEQLQSSDEFQLPPVTEEADPQLSRRLDNYPEARQAEIDKEFAKDDSPESKPDAA